MSNYNSLKATINANIKTNDNQEITGQVMNSVLMAMVNALGAGYQFAGVAVPSTNPGSPDSRVFYFAATPGTYTHFNGIVVDEGEAVILQWDTAWTKQVFASIGVGVAESENDADLDISDENGNVLARFEGGNFRVKNFDSRMFNPVIKKAVFMGDSITQGVYSYWNNGIQDDAHRYNGFDISNPASVAETTAYHGIPYFFNLLCRCETFVNLAKRGSGYVVDGRNLGNAKAVATSYSFANVDYVALCFGVNDYIQGATIGDLSTRPANSVIGNMCYVIEKILTDNPLCKVIVFSPYNTWGQVSRGGDYTSNVLYGDESTDYALGAAPPNKTHTLQDYIDAIDSVCQYYGIQHVALSKSNVINRVTIKNILIDGLHPSKESYIKLAAELYGKSNYSV